MEDADRWETEDQTHAGHEDKKKMARCLKLSGAKGKKNTQTWMQSGIRVIRLSKDLLVNYIFVKFI